MVKLLIGAVVGCVLGLWIGYRTASHSHHDWWRMEANAQNREQHFAAALCLDALLKLERGETDKVKATAASILASYERHFRDYDAAAPDGAHLIPVIRAASEHSAILRQELTREADTPTPQSVTPTPN
jgi:hypothetical protein